MPDILIGITSIDLNVRIGVANKGNNFFIKYFYNTNNLKITRGQILSHVFAISIL